MSLTFNYNSFEILIIKQKDCVTIRCLDKELFKIYQEVYNDMSISEFCPVGIDNFYEICKTSFDVLQSDKSSENAIVVLTCNEKNIKIQIDYKLQLHFSFTLKLPLIESIKMSGQDVVIKQLENNVKLLTNNVKLLTNNVESLNECINFASVCVYYRTCCLTANSYDNRILFLPINCNSIMLHYNNNNTQSKYNYTTREFSLSFHTCNNDKLTPDFKIIKCKLLKLSGLFVKDFGYEYLPDSIEKIEIYDMTDQISRHLDGFIKRKLPQFNTLQISSCGNCSVLTQDMVNSLSIKTLRVSNDCTNFNVTSTNKCTVERY